MTYRFLRPARAELDEAVNHYDRQEAGLGTRFLMEIANGIEKILEQPTAWARVTANIRQYRIDPFPYGIIYEIENEQAVIIAIADLRRRHLYWKGRF